MAFAAAVCAASPAGAESLLSRISVPNPHVPEHHYGEMHRFPESVRDYSENTLYGYAFRHELPGGAVREIQVSRSRTPGAYLMATDLFANGRFSTMSHTVLMVFPRRPAASAPYRVVPRASGEIHVVAPNASTLVIDGATGRIKSSDDFYLGPLGPPGTPPDFRYRGLHLTIRSVGRTPFLRGTPVTVASASGATCRLRTDDLFAYGAGPESDEFRFATDAELFAYLSTRCPGLAGGPLLREASSLGAAGAAPQPATLVTPREVPILVPTSSRSAVRAPHATNPAARRRPSRAGGLLWELFSR